MKTSDFDYDLPPEFIAQAPIEPRDASRLLVLHRQTGEIEHRLFRDLSQYLRNGDLLVLNQTRVIPARLYARKLPTGGKLELLLLQRLGQQTWETLVGGKGIRQGARIQVERGPAAEVIQQLDGSRRVLRFDAPLAPELERLGRTPLPPYITAPLKDPERYQTVYAREPGSAAAPTAGLHFTIELLEHTKSIGVDLAYVTLHVGLDTFAPIAEDSVEEHVIHTEWCRLGSETATAINATRGRGGRIVAAGTTTVRTLETAARAASPHETVAPYEGPTDLFILPGYKFNAVDMLLTNFHLPRSTLILLVGAFLGGSTPLAGRDRLLAAYEAAKEGAYRFYSFGDAMLIL